MQAKSLSVKFFDNTASSYNLVARWATFNKDTYWKTKILQNINCANSILELACGTGILTERLAKLFPHSEILGVDMSQSYLRKAKKNLESFSNVSFILQDAENLCLKKKFDCICSSYIPKYCEPAKLVDVCKKHLRSNGRVILHDFIFPENLLIRRFWSMYFYVLQGLGLFFSSWRYAFCELPKLIRSSNWLDSYSDEFQKNGFQIEIQRLTWNTSALLIADLQN